MSSREKVIVLCMLGAVVFGALQFFSSATRTGPVNAQQESLGLDQFVVTMAGTLNKPRLFESNYVLDKAAQPCLRDPFVAPTPAPAEILKTDGRIKPALPLAYTGYVFVGGHMVAVINGKEYESGETVEPGAYRINRITPERIELLSATGEKKDLELSNENR